jgi:hypothetical protein
MFMIYAHGVSFFFLVRYYDYAYIQLDNHQVT